MKKIFLSLVIVILMSSVCLAAPFLVCDPPLATDPVVVNYSLTGPAWVPAEVAAQADGSIRLDLGPAATGTNALTVSACGGEGGVWCSDPVPFTFTKPSAVPTPKTLKLSR